MAGNLPTPAPGGSVAGPDAGRGDNDAPTQLHDYRALLAQRDSAGQFLPVVGGHAVNFWAERFAAREPALAAWRPFASKDLDVIASRAEAERLARLNGWTLTPTVAGDLRAAEVHLARPNGEAGWLKVEFLEEILGLSAAEVAAATVQVGWQGTDQEIRVLNPVHLLAAKLRNAVDLEQDGKDRPPRQDVRHVQIVALCIPRFLSDVVAADRPADPEAKARIIEPFVLLLAAAARGYRGRTFEARHPGLVRWSALVPAEVAGLPLSPPVREAVGNLERLTASPGRGQTAVPSSAAARLENARQLLAAKQARQE